MRRDACRDESSSFLHRCAVQARRSRRKAVAIRKPKYPPGLIPHPPGMSLGTTCPDRGMVRVKETIGGQNLLGATAAPDFPLQYCVSMLSDATQPGRVLECELT